MVLPQGTLNICDKSYQYESPRPPPFRSKTCLSKINNVIKTTSASLFLPMYFTSCMHLLQILDTKIKLRMKYSQNW